jgi:hypothetical protein
VWHDILSYVIGGLILTGVTGAQHEENPARGRRAIAARCAGGI